MKKYLLPEEGTFYKANLHSHSRCSDGGLTVEEMRDEYKKRGYSILAISDHDVLRQHYELSQDDFLLLTAYEISIRSDDDPTPHAFRKVVDLNLIAKDPYNVTQVGYHPESVEYWIEKKRLSTEEFENIKFAGELRDMHYYPANINKIIKSANENGFMVTVNHPKWSLINYSDYGMFEGAWAVEIYNHGCYALSGLSDSEWVFDDILRTGRNIYAVAADDNHNNVTDNPVEVDSFGGFVMIKSQKLDYPSVIRAMEKGEFYASQGPEIYELYYEDGNVHIECSPCRDICMTTMGRRGIRVGSDDGGLITSADFKIDKELFGYVRFKIVDETGKKAFTNAYYVDEFEQDAKKRRIVV